MNIFIVCSKYCYDKVEAIQSKLEDMGHSVMLPNVFDDPFSEFDIRDNQPDKFAEWKGATYKESQEKVERSDCLLVLNYEKHGCPNYIGGNTLLEMYDGFKLGKPIYLMNPIPDNMLRDEILGFGPIVINEDLEKIVDKTKLGE